MTEQQQPTPSAIPAAGTFGGMSDLQLRQTISQLQLTAGAGAPYASPTPQAAHSKTYLKNLHTWSTTTTPPPKTAASGTRSTRARGARNTSTLAPPTPTPPVYQPLPIPMPIPIPVPVANPNPPRPPLPTSQQALYSTYASRLRTGATLLMQPILTTPSANTTRAATRRGGVINYADPGSGDDLPDAGALDSDDSDFIASGGTRTAIRQSRGKMGAGMAVFNPATGTTSTLHGGGTPRPEKAELDQTYLGMVPPARFIKSRPMAPTAHEYPTPDAIDAHAQRRAALVPIRVEFETDTHRVRDCFVWNLHERLIKPEAFARTFCSDLELPHVPWAETVTNQIRAQLEEHEGVASMELGIDSAPDINTPPHAGAEDLEDAAAPECRVILSIDVQIANHHLLDHIEWDLLSSLTPEAFACTLCMELGLGGEAAPLVAHAVHEELIKHKKDAIEWGVLGGDPHDGVALPTLAPNAAARDRIGFGLLKDKTGLGLGWGRAPKDGRGPKPLRSVWRDWAEAEEFRTVFEELSAEEVERREIERERASRRLRRETSKFQSSTRSRRR